MVFVADGCRAPKRTWLTPAVLRVHRRRRGLSRDSGLRIENEGYDHAMSKTSANADAKRRAQEKVAQLKQRLAKQQGVTAADPVNTAEGEHAPAQARVARAQPHPAARTQRPQGRREGK